MKGRTDMLFGLKKTITKYRDMKKFCTAIVAAAGSSRRMGGENKLMMPLQGIPVLAHTLMVLDQAETIDAIVVATREEDVVTVAGLAKTYGIMKPLTVVPGGETRTESVTKALAYAPEATTHFAVQDGARPLVTPQIIDAAVRKAAECGAAAPAVPVKDTVKFAENRVVTYTPDRSMLFAVQTPQVFDADLLKAALTAAAENGTELTDDCSAVEQLGKEIYLTEGSYQNIKITTPEDLAVAEAILQWRVMHP